MENLTITEIQARCDAMARAMSDKGVENPNAEFCIKSNTETVIWLHGTDIGGKRSPLRRFCSADQWHEAAAFIAALPDPSTEGQRRFTRALADAVDIATEYALDDSLVAPVKAAIAEVNAALLEGPK